MNANRNDSAVQSDPIREKQKSEGGNENRTQANNEKQQKCQIEAKRGKKQMETIQDMDLAQVSKDGK